MIAAVFAVFVFAKDLPGARGRFDGSRLVLREVAVQERREDALLLARPPKEDGPPMAVREDGPRDEDGWGFTVEVLPALVCEYDGRVVVI